MITLGHWRRKETLKNSGENTEQNDTETKGKARQRQQDPGTQVVPETSSLLTESWLDPERACDLEGGSETGGQSLGNHGVGVPFT